MPELTVQYGRYKCYAVPVVKYSAEVVLLYYYCMNGASPETLTTVHTPVFYKPGFAVTYAKGLCRADPHAE
jgi:hypothetical protein